VAKKAKRRSRTRKGVSKSWGRTADVKINHPPMKLAIPSGECPVTLADTSYEAILEWVVALTECKPEPHTYQLSVYRYWVRNFYDIFSEEYKIVISELEKIVTCDIKTINDLEGQ
jgi:hypothetical protein|tara:strand:- start:42 stop:386 length:345 start_codon:yes stop_codon:yes gene_type:complete